VLFALTVLRRSRCQVVVVIMKEFNHPIGLDSV